MKKSSVLKTTIVAQLASIILTILATQLSYAKSTSETEIPERREFPLSTQVGPCEDFYQYTCGPVINAFELPSDRSRWVFSFSDSDERILRHKKKFLSGLGGKARVRGQDNSARSMQYVNYYKSCMNTEARKMEEAQHVQETLRQFADLQKKRDSKKAMLDYLGANALRGAGPRVTAFFDSNNQKDSNKVDLIFWVDFRNLPERSYYETAKVVEDYRALVKKFFETIGLDNAQARADRVVEFEKAFAQVYPTEAEMREVWTREDAGIAREQAINKYPALRLNKGLSAVPRTAFIRHMLPQVYEYANAQLLKISFEDLRDVVLYSYLGGSLRYAYPEYYKQATQFGIAHLGEAPQKPPLDEECADLVSSKFDREIDAALFESMFPNFPEAQFREMVELVRRAMSAKLSQNSWLQPETKQLALEKLESIRMQVVRPAVEKDWDFAPIRSYSPTKYLKNAATLGMAKLQASFKRVGRPADKDVWGMGPLTVNAYYNPPESKFVMPAGILQYPFYDVAGSLYENLGAVGMVVGHEVGHSFDDQGSKYDKFGNVNPWMGEADLAKFAEISGRIDAQYIAACKQAVDNLELLTVKDSSSIPPKEDLYKICEGDEQGNNNYADLTRGENIGDIAGMQFAYAAAFPNGVGSVADKQKFFLQYGKIWCSKVRAGGYISRLRTDEHAQIPMRTNEPVKHLDGFYEAFSCKAGDAMYLPPEERVNIW